MPTNTVAGTKQCRRRRRQQPPQQHRQQSGALGDADAEQPDQHQAQRWKLNEVVHQMRQPPPEPVAVEQAQGTDGFKLGLAIALDAALHLPVEPDRQLR
jgi:hypothetical protein